MKLESLTFKNFNYKVYYHFINFPRPKIIFKRYFAVMGTKSTTIVFLAMINYL